MTTELSRRLRAADRVLTVVAFVCTVLFAVTTVYLGCIGSPLAMLALLGTGAGTALTLWQPSRAVGDPGPDSETPPTIGRGRP